MLDSEFDSLSNDVSFKGVTGGEHEGANLGMRVRVRVYRLFLLRSSHSKLTSFDRQLNSEPSTTTFRLSTDHGANPGKKYNIFMYKRWVKKPVFYPKLFFFARWLSPKQTSFDREPNSEPITISFRLSTGHGTNLEKKNSNIVPTSPTLIRSSFQK